MNNNNIYERYKRVLIPPIWADKNSEYTNTLGGIKTDTTMITI